MINTVAASHRINKGMEEGSQLDQLFAPRPFVIIPVTASWLCVLLGFKGGVSLTKLYLELGVLFCFFVERIDLAYRFPLYKTEF